MANSSKVMLQEVDIENEAFQLLMMDDSKWFVNPGDLATVATWLPTTILRLKKNRDSMFNFDITNTSDDTTVKAMQVV